jgi:HK97 family phage major capsid protein
VTRIRITSQIEEARTKHAEAIEKMEEADAKLQALPDDATDEERTFHSGYFTKCVRDAERWAETIERLVAIEEARQTIPPATDDDDAEQNATPVGSRPARNGGGTRVAVRGEKLTYHKNAQHSFFQDMYAAERHHDAGAQKRLQQHNLEMRMEQRDVTTADPGAAGFIPPLYLAEQWIELPRPRRPFADALPKVPLSNDGMRMDFPRVQTGATVAIQATENSAVSETDPDSETYSVNVRTIAGQVDMSRQSFERSRPGFDQVVFRDLMRAYDGALDTQLIAGAGTSGTHLGLRAISGVNTVTATGGDASNTVKYIYQAAAAIATTAFVQADTVIMNPRRSAAIAAYLGSTFPLLNQGGLSTTQVGTQNNAFAGTIAGLNVIADANIATNYGASTNQDEIYVVALDELMLAEGTLTTAVFPDVGSGTLTVRVQVYAYSAAPTGRIPKAITVISGTNLVTPTFA